MAGTCVVHLVWAPLGPEPFERFLASYRRHPAGAPHHLLLLFKEFSTGRGLYEYRRALDGLPCEARAQPRWQLDLGAYPDVVRATDFDRYLFLNSASEILADDWLANLERPLERPGVGLVGATGSWERMRREDPDEQRRFPPFPNPHVRTNAFMLDRDVALGLDWPEPRTKPEAWLLESGSDSLTRQVAAAGLEVLVVGRDGEPHEPAGWARSATFRAGAQENLLVADNQTRDFNAAEPGMRRLLAAVAWGDPELGAVPQGEARRAPATVAGAAGRG